MIKKIPFNSGDEVDALTTCKSFYRWRAGARKKIKQRYNKRFRKSNKVILTKVEV